ncbi:MAG: hypothetical protein U0324_25275 [Polyangiales bacterium]
MNRSPRALAPTVVAALLFAATGALVTWRFREASGVAVGRLAPPPPPALAHATRDDILLTERVLTPPPWMLNEQACLSGPRRWAFPGLTASTTAAVLARVLRGPGLALAQASIRCAPDGCVVDAPAAVVTAVIPSERASFYASLGATAANQGYAFPFRRHPSRPAFADSPGLPPAAREVVAQTSWTQDGVLMFADLPAACERMRDDAERTALARAIHRPWTMDVALRTAPASVERLVATVAPRARAVARAKLTRARETGRATVPIDELLPEPARRRVGTWATASEETLNCFWTALHFEDGDPRERLLSLPAVESALRARYRPLGEAPARFGDVMAFRNADGGLEHLAVHLFAGVFYTKNGISTVQPWRISRVEDVALDYPATRSVELWRRLDEP